MTYYLLLFASGFVGSFHCVGMCGGFACALGRDPRGRRATVVRHLNYNSGRLTTSCFLGGVAGTLGQAFCTPQALSAPQFAGSLDLGQRILAIVAGLLMIAMALQLLGLLTGFRRFALGFGSTTFALSLGRLLNAPGSVAALAFGVLNGFLPCPLVYAFAAQAASSAGALPGVLTMAIFGLGTFPAMLMTGGVGQFLGRAWRHRGVWLAGGLILLFGLVTIGRALLPLHVHASHRPLG